MIGMLINIVRGFISILKGLAVTGRNMFRGALTLPYPAQRPVMTERFRGLVDLYPEKCIACSQCVRICPTAALDLVAAVNAETKKRVLSAFTYNGELCCFCGLCQEVCPTSAIYLNQCYEAAYYDHKDFVRINLLNGGKYDHLARPVTKGKKK